MTAVSDSVGFIYIRVPRTASESFTTVLREQFAGEMHSVGAMHSSALEVREHYPEKWKEYFTFGFIRNPWEWMVSVYDAGIWQGAGCKEVWAGGRVIPYDNPFIEPGECMGMKFSKWLPQRKTTPIDWLSDDKEVIVDRVYRMEDFVGEVRKHVRSHDRPHYRDYYTKDLADYVAQKCHREIELGGYKF